METKSKVRNIAGRQRREALAASSTYDIASSTNDILGREDGGIDVLGREDGMASIVDAEGVMVDGNEEIDDYYANLTETRATARSETRATARSQIHCGILGRATIGLLTTPEQRVTMKRL